MRWLAVSYPLRTNFFSRSRNRCFLKSKLKDTRGCNFMVREAFLIGWLAVDPR